MGPLVAVIGGSSPTVGEASLAEDVGRLLAEAGAVLICGGRGGVMEAACRGAKAVGGTTIGILPGRDQRDANPYVDIPIVTGIGEARNAIIAHTAEVAIAVGGSYGTLSEIAYVLGLGKPLIGLRTWVVEREGHSAASIVRVETATDAVEEALARLKSAGGMSSRLAKES
ncbi:MAG: TIGR00725 family protein [Anaerolineae bacterium]|jgi:uncharacterized protein (TIGR00725 family)